ncbi:hypothetical protein DFS34DRAFT_690934 [Phlyctochytrium arcticum]|nr:hypothetical protein DFS34DRAFT_690934 [Phlyctochytrium arcticum]
MPNVSHALLSQAESPNALDLAHLLHAHPLHLLRRRLDLKNRCCPRLQCEKEGEAIQGRRRQKNPCDCHLLDSTIQNMTVHYRSNQRECLLHGKSLAERKELKRQITRIKTGEPVRSSTGSAHSKSSTSRPLPGERPPTVVNETDQVDEEQEVQEDQMGENEEQQEQEESNAKSKFSVKLGLTKTVKSDAMGERIVDAVLRFNEITYHGLKLLSVYTIMLGKTLPPFDRPDGKRLIRQCFYAVSVTTRQTVPATPDRKWPSREALNQSLTYHTTTVMADIRRHIVVHLVSRITKYARIKLTHILGSSPSNVSLDPRDVKELAQRLTKRLVYNEKQAWVIAKNKNEDPPPIPAWARPSDVLLSTHKELATAVSQVFDSVVHRVEGSENPWLKRYYPLHRFLLREMEELNGTVDNNIGGDGSEEPIRIAESAPRIHHAWARRKVTKICGRHPEVFVSRRSRRRATMALLKAVTNRLTLEANSEGSSRGNRSCKRRGILPESIMTEVKTKAAKTIRKLEGSFCLKGTGKPTGQDRSRLWTLLPQPSLRRRHMLLDTTTLVELYKIIDCRRALEYETARLAARKKIWAQVFHLERVKGVDFSERPLQGKRREFTNIISTDGEACSFICRRPKAGATGKADPPSPRSVCFDEEVVFRSIDPGESDVISGYIPRMTFDPNDRHRLSPSQPDIDQQRMPATSSPHQQRKEKAKMGKETTFGMSGKEWRHLAGHNFTDQWRDAWKKEVAAVAGCLKEECWQDDESQTPPPVPSVTDDPDDVEELRWEALDEDDDNNTAKDDKQKEWDVEPMYRYIYKGSREAIYAVRHCQKCYTTWNRDTNAARNIAFLFWYQRRFGVGKRPFPLRRSSPLVTS